MYNASSVILASLYLIKLEVFLFAGTSSHFLLLNHCSFVAHCDLIPRHTQTENEAQRLMACCTPVATSVSVAVEFKSARGKYSSNASSFN